MKKTIVLCLLTGVALLMGALATSETVDYFYANTGTIEFKDQAKFGDDLTLTFGADDDATIEYDEDGNNELLVTGAARVNGALEYKVPYLSDTDNETLTAAQSGGVFTNDGDSDTQTYTLPTAAAGLTFTFIDVESAAGADLHVTPASGDDINDGSTATAYKQTADNGYEDLEVVAIDATTWAIIKEDGTWAE